MYVILCLLRRRFISTLRCHAQAGLQRLTADISQLVNLRVLTLDKNRSLTYIPESISCLQKLEELCIDNGQIRKLPVGLGKLANLVSLQLNSLRFENFNFPFTLTVIGPGAGCTLVYKE
jgi:Leucine-rich repeat (LRR) protein